MVFLDILRTDVWMNYVISFDDEDDSSLSPYFEQIGFESRLSVINLGSTFVFTVILLLLFVLYLILQALSNIFKTN